MQPPFDRHDRHHSPGPHFCTLAPGLELEITRGLARHRIRPVQVRIFLIGTAGDCDLVLGDTQFPHLHAYILRTPRNASICWLRQGPEVLVNNQAVSDLTWLADGDVITTGPYEFKVHLTWPSDMLPSGPVATPRYDVIPNPSRT